MRIVTLAALGVVAGSIVACSDIAIGDPATSANSPTKLVVFPALDTMAAGDTVRFTSLRDSGGTTVRDSGTVWTVSDSRVATIEQQGQGWVVARTLRQGATTVAAARGAHTASAVLIVHGNHLVITSQPTATTLFVYLRPMITVSIEDTAGRVVAAAIPPVTITLDSNPNHTILQGAAGTTATPIDGVATFPYVEIAGSVGTYTFTASANGFLSVRSAPFTVTHGP